MDNKRKATIHDYARLCHSQGSCTNCLLGFNCNGKRCNCKTFVIDCPDKANEVILEWCDEHPVKTYADDFFEKFPNAKRKINDATPAVCRNTVYGITSCCLGTPCEECWLEEYKEDAE